MPHSRPRSSTFALMSLVLLAVGGVASSQYASNLFLNGQYKNGLHSHPASSYRPDLAGEFATLISKRASPFVGQMYLPTLLECHGRQQCVPKSQCVNGQFSHPLPKVQHCTPEDNVCCTYNPPPPPPPPPQQPRPQPTALTTTVQIPFVTCGPHMACVSARDCHNGEIVGTTVVNVNSNKCYAPKVCCGVPATMLTVDGYILKMPQSPYAYPASTQGPAPFAPVTTVSYKPVTTSYLPPTPVTPQRPVQPVTPQRPVHPVTPQKPVHPVTPQRPVHPVTPQRPVQPVTPQRPVQPVTPYRPAQPVTPHRPVQPVTPHRPVQPVPASTAVTPVRTPFVVSSTKETPAVYTGAPKYLPPLYTPPQKQNEIINDRETQPSNVQKVSVYRGEAQLSPQIFPPKKYGTSQLAPAQYAKCASALVCTPNEYCNSIGVISEKPVEISPFRVPLTDCLLEGTGQPGKCCRDSNYVDPWPVNLAGVCAQRNKNTKPRGIRDIDANFAEIPWQVMVLKESTKSLLCGGAIIGDGVALTTASCVKGVAVNDVRVKAGEWQLGSTDEPLPFQLVSVKSIVLHPHYDPATGSNDMAVLHLAERLQFATHIQPICISDKEPSPSETCITTGWGKQALSIHEEGAIMHVTTTTPTDRSTCAADASGVCVATNFDSCQFDSGSALACGSGSSVLLKGIYSVENACGEGQVVRFIKPDIAWVNQQFLERSKPLLLRQ